MGNFFVKLGSKFRSDAWNVTPFFFFLRVTSIIVPKAPIPWNSKSNGPSESNASPKVTLIFTLKLFYPESNGPSESNDPPPPPPPPERSGPFKKLRVRKWLYGMLRFYSKLINLVTPDWNFASRYGYKSWRTKKSSKWSELIQYYNPAKQLTIVSCCYILNI